MAEPFSGYVADVPYTLHAYREQGPLNLLLAAALGGVEPNAPMERFRYLELGAGHGVTVATLAAAFPEAEFHALDLNPAHVSTALKLKHAGKLDNLHVHLASFREAAAHGLPECDFIAAHGVYAWVADGVRRDLRRVLHTRLRPGGLFYVSYNAQPGWAGLAPVQELLRAKAATRPGDSGTRAREAALWLQKLARMDPRFLQESPGAGELIEGLPKLAPAYLAHEYLNEFWRPLYVTEVMAELREARLRYAADAALARNFPELVLSADRRAFVRDEAAGVHPELMKDVLLGTRFRRDVYVKGGIDHAASHRHRLLAPFRFVRNPGAEPGEEMVFHAVKVPVSALARALLAAADEAPIGLDDATGVSAAAGQAREAGLSTLQLLIAAGLLVPAARGYAAGREPLAEGARGRVCGLNRALLDRAVAEGSGTALAAPVLGGPIGISDMEARMLDAWLADGPRLSAQRLMQALRARGQSLLEAGEPVRDPDRASALIEERLRLWHTRTLPKLVRSGAVEIAPEGAP